MTEEKTNIERELGYNIGLSYFYGWGGERDYSKSLEFFISSARKGKIGAVFMVGYMYNFALGVKKDIDIAVRCYSYGDKFNNAYSQYYLAKLYLFGLGVEKNEKRASELFKKAEKKGVKNDLFFT